MWHVNRVSPIQWLHALSVCFFSYAHSGTRWASRRRSEFSIFNGAFVNIISCRHRRCRDLEIVPVVVGVVRENLIRELCYMASANTSIHALCSVSKCIHMLRSIWSRLLRSCYRSCNLIGQLAGGLLFS